MEIINWLVGMVGVDTVAGYIRLLFATTCMSAVILELGIAAGIAMGAINLATLTERRKPQQTTELPAETNWQKLKRMFKTS